MQTDLGFDDAFSALIATLRLGYTGRVGKLPAQIWLGVGNWDTAATASGHGLLDDGRTLDFEADQEPETPWMYDVGANLEFGNGRFTAEYTYAQKTTKDQILPVDFPAAAGFKVQWQNTGELRARTHEASLGARLIDGRTTTLTLNIVGDRTRQMITEWNLPERLYSFGSMPSAFFLGNNSNLGVLYGNHWIRDID